MSCNARLKIGISGGTFDPIHLGHIALMKAACDAFELDKVLVMPTDDPYYKSKRKISSFEDRLNMVKLAVSCEPKLEASDFERVNDTDGYTYDVLKLFKQQNPDAEIYFILGGDSLFSIEYWKNAEDIFKMAVILVSKRHGESKGASGELPKKINSEAKGTDNALTKSDSKDVISKCYTTININITKALSQAVKNEYNEKENGEISNSEIHLDNELDKQIAYLKNKFGARIFNLYSETVNVSSTMIRKKAAAGEDISRYVPDEVAEYIMEHKMYMLCT